MGVTIDVSHWGNQKIDLEYSCTQLFKTALFVLFECKITAANSNIVRSMNEFQQGYRECAESTKSLTGSLNWLLDVVCRLILGRRESPKA